MADFQMLYLREAHPIDDSDPGRLANSSGDIALNRQEDVCYRQPRTLEERISNARHFVERTNWPMPVLVDSMDDFLDKMLGAPPGVYVLERGLVSFRQPAGGAIDSDELIAFLQRRFPTTAAAHATSVE